MNRPNAAKTSAPTQATSPETTHTQPGIRAPPRAPTAKTIATDSAPSTIAVSTLMSTYAVGFSGVSRSWRDQPTARSMATDAPPAVVAIIAPYTARLIITYAVTLPRPALSA